MNDIENKINEWCTVHHVKLTKFQVNELSNLIQDIREESYTLWFCVAWWKAYKLED